MKQLKQQFLGISDALGLENLTFDTHQVVFAGGTALAKSNIT
ncbi:hypothetical protein VXS02_08600 [Photobacterium piscicola]|uniref:Uncharacterized protein n=1 Tax=Photobacterium piscicola TaxID=1378299 RepID=A0ABU6LFU2_9GAMM|nr:hypothetical protein [Photobacterium piscicola]MEC6881863.1 hypothetical protein [Photobacterium piscicola]MEC6898404.1 hypothetical protein [Photobacterium piscicola]